MEASQTRVGELAGLLGSPPSLVSQESQLWPVVLAPHWLAWPRCGPGPCGARLPAAGALRRISKATAVFLFSRLRSYSLHRTFKLSHCCLGLITSSA